MKTFAEIYINNQNDGDINIEKFNISYNNGILKVSINDIIGKLYTRINEDDMININLFSDKIIINVI